MLITRPLPEGKTTADLAERLGAQTHLVPVLQAQPPDDPKPLIQALANLHRYQGMVFTSAHAARIFLETPHASIVLPRLHAVGKKTAALLTQAGFPATIPNQPLGGEELARNILRESHPGDRFLFLRAQEGRDEVTTLLSRAGRIVDQVAAYRMAPIPALDQKSMTLLHRGQIDAIPFFSGRSAHVFFNLLPADTRQLLLKKPLLAALSPTTAHTMQQSGMRVDLVSSEPNAETLLALLAYTLEINFPPTSPE
ncbi:MAG: uroporphyrinogen-III synthase [Magnetococcales bacterium]|nr:uroporphyrinogen-III synthase [Magnetococcales bacterium]